MICVIKINPVKNSVSHSGGKLFPPPHHLLCRLGNAKFFCIVSTSDELPQLFKSGSNLETKGEKCRSTRCLNTQKRFWARQLPTLVLLQHIQVGYPARIQSAQLSPWPPDPHVLGQIPSPGHLPRLWGWQTPQLPKQPARISPH